MYFKIIIFIVRVVISMMIMIIRIVMIVIYGVFEFCVDFNIFKNLEIYFKKLYFKFDFEFYLIILNLIS